jgi:hypothetical protein
MSHIQSPFEDLPRDLARLALDEPRSADVLIEALVALLRLLVDATDKGWQSRGDAEFDIGETLQTPLSTDQGIQLILRLQHAPARW